MKPLEVNYVQANGDCALLIFFKSHPQGLLRLQALAEYIRLQKVSGIVDVVPAVDSLMLVFDRPIGVDDHMMAAVNEACVQSLSIEITSKSHEIPVCYHPEVAPDIKTVMSHTGLTKDQVVELHCKPIYEISFLGFLPGFAYMSGLAESLNIPRKSAPSKKTPAGSVAIANSQTGIYALNSPGGWHVIGRTPMPLVDWQAKQNLRFQPLDKIQFKPIGIEQFRQEYETH